MKRFLAAAVLGGSLVAMGGAASAQYAPATTTSSVLGTTIVQTTVRPAVATSAPAQVLGVQTTRGGLAQTGQDAAPLAFAGAGLVGAGAIFVAASRRRREADAR